jgi:hypothetical protein
VIARWSKHHRMKCRRIVGCWTRGEPAVDVCLRVLVEGVSSGGEYPTVSFQDPATALAPESIEPSTVPGLAPLAAPLLGDVWREQVGAGPRLSR